MKGPTPLPDDPSPVLKGLYGVAHARMRKVHQMERQLEAARRAAKEDVDRYERAREAMVQWTIDDVLADKNAR